MYYICEDLTYIHIYTYIYIYVYICIYISFSQLEANLDVGIRGGGRCCGSRGVGVSWLYVSAYYYMCPHTLYTCPHTTICVRILLYIRLHPLYVSAYHYMYVRILLHMCRRNTVYMFSCYYI